MRIESVAADEINPNAPRSGALVSEAKARFAAALGLARMRGPRTLREFANAAIAVWLPPSLPGELRSTFADEALRAATVRCVERAAAVAAARCATAPSGQISASVVGPSGEAIRLVVRAVASGVEVDLATPAALTAAIAAAVPVLERRLRARGVRLASVRVAEAARVRRSRAAR